MKDYKMTTVKNYVDILDSELTTKEKTIKSSIEEFLYKSRKARSNANLLDELLA